MKTFTVHTPPPSASAQKDALDTVFVREGFAIWAFLIPLLWLIVNRMWLVFLGYAVLTGLLEGAAYLVGDIAPGIFAFLVTILFGLEANTLRRWTLDRKGYRFVAVASGRTLEEAERRYFDSAANGSAKILAGAERARSATPLAGVRSGPGTGSTNPFAERPVTGLFPQSEKPR